MQRRSTDAPFRKRQRQKTTISGTKLVIGVAIILVGILWTVGVALFSFTLNDRSEKKGTPIFPDLPVGGAALWPDERTNLDFKASLRDCESDVVKCKERIQAGSSQQRIAILRPPGVFGRSMENFVTQAVANHAIEKVDILLIPTSHIELEHTYTKVVRVATLPLLLEAIDLALLTVDADYTADQISREDILEVVRQLVGWHCHLSQVASDTALTTLTFGRGMSLPTRTAKALTSFFSFAETDDVKEEIDMEDSAEQIVRRIDQCTKLASKINDSEKSARKLDDDVDRVIQEELQNGACSSTIPSLHTGSIPFTRVTEIVGHFLDINKDSSSIICGKYPHVPMCVDHAVIADE
jgi:hypothetical protein